MNGSSNGIWNICLCHANKQHESLLEIAKCINQKLRAVHSLHIYVKLHNIHIHFFHIPLVDNRHQPIIGSLCYLGLPCKQVDWWVYMEMNDVKQTSFQIFPPADHLSFPFNHRISFKQYVYNQLPIKMLATIMFLFLLIGNSFVTIRHKTQVAIGDGKELNWNILLGVYGMHRFLAMYEMHPTQTAYTCVRVSTIWLCVGLHKLFGGNRLLLTKLSLSH